MLSFMRVPPSEGMTSRDVTPIITTMPGLMVARGACGCAVVFTTAMGWWHAVGMRGGLLCG